MHRWFAAMVGSALLSTACGLPCRTDNDCQTAGGVERCVVETGVCEPLPTRPPPTCAGDADCEGGRSCVDESCVFVPQCQRFTAPGPLNFAGVCDGTPVSGAATLSTAGCTSSVNLEGVGELELGVINPEVLGGLIIGDCADAAFEAASGIIGLSGCAVGAALSCDLSVTLRAPTQACVVGDGPACPADAQCGAVAVAGAVSAGRCE